MSTGCPRLSSARNLATASNRRDRSVSGPGSASRIGPKADSGSLADPDSTARRTCVHGQNGGAPSVSRQRPVTPRNPSRRARKVASSAKLRLSDTGFTGEQHQPAEPLGRLGQPSIENHELRRPAHHARPRHQIHRPPIGSDRPARRTRHGLTLLGPRFNVSGADLKIVSPVPVNRAALTQAS